MLFTPFSCLTARATTSRTMWKGSDEEHSCLVPKLSRKTPTPSLFSICSFSVNTLHPVEDYLLLLVAETHPVVISLALNYRPHLLKGTLVNATEADPSRLTRGTPGTCYLAGLAEGSGSLVSTKRWDPGHTGARIWRWGPGTNLWEARLGETG